MIVRTVASGIGLPIRASTLASERSKTKSPTGSGQMSVMSLEIVPPASSFISRAARLAA